MKRSNLTLAVVLSLLSCAAVPPTRAADVPNPTAAAATPAAATAPAPQPQWLYVLRLVPRLHDDQAWTDADNATIGRHFQHLKDATAARKVILAGRTTEAGGRTFGLVIFEAPDEAAARRFMDSDPAVVGGLMTATLHPYAIALQRKP
ncbi:MAG TPA: YciI family protein [Steroidobacteraceae bacterium]|nr:YciI family protein [Steroidobacteraceae bacterium]